jgi:WXG100 family type VII secretion target
MSTIGGEIGQLHSLRSTFDREAQAVQELTTRIRGELGNTWWKGPASDRFRDAWGSQFEPSLRKLQTALQEASTEVNRRTEALLQAGS